MRYCSRSMSSAHPRCESGRRLGTRLTTPTWQSGAVFVAIPTSRRLDIAVRASSVNSNGTGSGVGNGSGPVGVSNWAGSDVGNAFGTLWSTAVEAEQHEQYQVAIIGDMHYKEEQDAAYVEARQQFLRVFDAQPESGRAVVQLGDVGTGPTSGSREAFAVAKGVLDGFEVPYYLIMGNHDMEGKEFEADRDNVDAWRACFQQNHFWCADVGACLLVGLSTERYRDNPDSHHEVYVSPGQLEWFAKLLQDNPDRPVVVFTHAPPLGCGLKVITDLHIKNRCAWLNTSSEPEVFVELVKAHPNVHLWFSGHFHLSHNYANSISTVGTAAFVQTGVIGPHCCRDGYRQSRLLQVDALGYRVLTLDHSTGATRLDLQAPWWPSEVPQPVTPDDELVCDPADGYLCSADQCSILDSKAIQWFRIGPEYLLALQDGMLVDYHIRTLSPIGCSCLDVGDRQVRLLDAEGVDVTFRQQGDGSDVATVVLLEADGSVSETISRNQYGSFFRLYQPNKWQIAKQKVLVEASAAAATATA